MNQIKYKLPAIFAGILLNGAILFAQPPSNTDLTFVPPAEVDFQRQSQILGSVFPIKLNKFEQITQNSFNWSGPNDAGLTCEIGFTPQAIIVRGTVLDDQPFVQSSEFPKRPAWWGIPYAGDGIEFHLDEKTSSSNRLQFYLNFSSAGVNPRVVITESPGQGKREFNVAADFRLLPLLSENPAVPPPPGFRFEVAIPVDGLVEPRFFSGALRMSVRLHDLDGDYKTYKMLEEVVEKSE